PTRRSSDLAAAGCFGPCACPLIVRAQVPQIPSRQSESNAIGASPRSVSSSLTISSISRKEVSGEIFVALYSTSFPFDCRSFCRQILKGKFIRSPGHPERSAAEPKDPAAVPLRFATGSLDFARDDGKGSSLIAPLR